MVCVHEAHNNFRTAQGTYRRFARVLEEVGYRIRRVRERASTVALDSCAILVVAEDGTLTDDPLLRGGMAQRRAS